MKLYVTRHGETEYSLKNIVCGSTDCPLTDEGRSQARFLSETMFCRNIHIDTIYTSPLVRAIETAEIISKAISAPYVIDERLREQNCGAFEGAVDRDDEGFNAARYNFANRLKGGDSAFRVVQRVYNFLDDITAAVSGQTILIVGHACVCKAIHSYFFELSNDEYYDYKLGNCELAEYL